MLAVAFDRAEVRIYIAEPANGNNVSENAA